MISVYGLTDPRSGELKYVGATRRLLSVRLSNHISAIPSKGQSPRVKWLRELVKQGLRPEIFTIEAVDDFQGAEAERFYIQYFRYIGCKLTNFVTPIVHPPIDMDKIDPSLPQEILDLLVHRRRGRPRNVRPCTYCGDKGYGAPLIEGQKVPLCRRHYNTWYKRRQRAKEKELDCSWAL